MSKKVTENTEEKQEKVLTRYDLKMQKRAEEKKRAEKEKKAGTIGGILIVAALACLVASFPIRTYLTVNGTYIKIGGENISRVEFDYNYSIVANSYIAQNGYYLSMFGLDLSGDLSTQMYSDTMTWKDFFEQMTVDSIASNKALRDQAKAAGFTCDVTQDYEEFLDNFRDAAAEEGVSLKEYYKECYGVYATASRLKDYICESLEVSAYYDQVTEEKKPSGEEIDAYYAENADSYDSVDYRLTVVNAQLPTEPTELADPVEETGDAESTEAADGEEAAYQPSEAEIAFAMTEARKEAEEALKTVSSDGELRENVLRSSVVSQLRDWMFDSERKAGDTTVIENETSHLYYVAEFVKRYRDETPTQNARVIIVSADAAVREDAILEEWRNGEATEDSFAEIADKYTDSAYSAPEGGLYEGLIPSDLTDALAEWLGDSARVKGDATAIAGEEGLSSYVVYYVGTNDPEWRLDIQSTLLQQTVSDYMAEIRADYEVEDPKGNLNYLKVQAALAAAGSDEAESSEGASADGEN
ncbi:MAG: SurA N-terminal domain-containing protein [bacterium]|nr:SurA N-terminal domain-containing protein [bacterium]